MDYWTTDVDKSVRLRTETDDLDFYFEPRTIIQQLYRTVDKHGDKPAICYSETLESEYKTITWAEYDNLSNQAAQCLIHLGLKVGVGVGIMGFNHPVWFIINMAIIKAGGVVAGMYTTNSAETCEHIINDSNSKIVFVETEEHVDRLIETAEKTDLKAVVCWGPVSSHKATPFELWSWDDFIAISSLMELGDDLQHRIHALSPNKCSTLIYTSGTTGPPKGVMLSHDNILWTTASVLRTVNIDDTSSERVVSYLPLSHVAAQMVDIYMPLFTGGCTWFSHPSALKGTLVNTLQAARPTIFLGVPRVWEKIQETMAVKAAELSSTKRRISSWAKDKGKRRYFHSNGRQRAELKKPFGWGVANKFVFTKVKDTLGLNECKLHFTGAAPIRKETLEYFSSLDIPIFDLYGMSECTGPMTISYPGCWRVGTSGKPFPGTALQIIPETGEICTKGRHVMMGYLGQIDKTRETIDTEGWLHSGDIGYIDSDGYLHITGRIKEIIITAGGENVPPVPIEDALKTALPFISNCMVIGDERKYLTMLITLKCEINPETNEPTNKLSPAAISALEKIHCYETEVDIARLDPHVNAAIDSALETINNRAPSRAQRVQKYHILDTDFSVPGGELGPTLKLKRPVVMKKYSAFIEFMY